MEIFVLSLVCYLSQTGSAQPKLEMDTCCWEIGEVSGGEKILLVNRFTNVGDSDLYITDFTHCDGGLGGPKFPRYAIKPWVMDSVYTEMLVPTHRSGRFAKGGSISTNAPSQTSALFYVRGTIVQVGPQCKRQR